MNLCSLNILLSSDRSALYIIFNDSRSFILRQYLMAVHGEFPHGISPVVDRDDGLVRLKYYFFPIVSGLPCNRTCSFSIR